MTDRLILCAFRLSIGLLLLALGALCAYLWIVDKSTTGDLRTFTGAWMAILFLTSQLWLFRALRSEAWYPPWPPAQADPNDTTIDE